MHPLHNTDDLGECLRTDLCLHTSATIFYDSMAVTTKDDDDGSDPKYNSEEDICNKYFGYKKNYKQ